MPEEVTERPRIYKVVELSTSTRGNEDRYLELGVDDLRKQIVTSRGKLLQKHPEKAVAIENTYNFLYNVLLIDEAESEKDVERKVFAARIQQILVHNALYASSYASSQGFSRNVYETIKATEIVSSKFKEQGYNFSIFMTGAKAELAIVKSLVEDGLAVYVPDYSKPYDASNPYDNEVYQLDVRDGVDFFTLIERGEKIAAVLINAKANAQFQGVHLGRVSTNEIGIYTRTMLKNYGVSAFARAQITISSKGLGFGRREADQQIDYRHEMERYCELNQDSKIAIIEGVENLARMSLNGV